MQAEELPLDGAGDISCAQMTTTRNNCAQEETLAQGLDDGGFRRPLMMETAASVEVSDRC